jgi:hypothetical protein
MSRALCLRKTRSGGHESFERVEAVRGALSLFNAVYRHTHQLSPELGAEYVSNSTIVTIQPSHFLVFCLTRRIKCVQIRAHLCMLARMRFGA